MAHQPRPAHQLPDQGDDSARDASAELRSVPEGSIRSRWRQPRGAGDAYVDIGRRELPALTSLRFFAAAYVVLHHLVNFALLHDHGPGADRTATWYLAWATQGHVGVTFFFVLSGFILAWCYHRTFATAGDEARPAARRRFWRARFARVWPLHAAMFALFLPLALSDFGLVPEGLLRTSWRGILNLLLLHAWVPWGGPDGIADTFNAPSWTLSCEAFFYVAFPLVAVLVVRRLRWGSAQLLLSALAAWVALGAFGAAVDGAAKAEWLMRVFPPVRMVDFAVGVALGLVVVQGLQRRALDGRELRAAHASGAWTALEALVLAAAAASPLVWALGAGDALPSTLGVSWFHLPTMAAAIVVLALERGAISRRLLAVRPLVWLGEVSYALYLVHLFIVLAAFKVGVYDLVGSLAASLLLAAASIVVAGVVHVRFEQPVRAWLTARR
jgi:peptidoglycan/LPS O-acetylase OafA/YrhL